MEHGRFTMEELQTAKDTDLCDVAEKLGYTVKRIGHFHTLKEMDSLRIYNRRSWFRWSREHDSSGRGGSQIDFLKVFAGMGTREAVFWLLDFAGYSRDAPGVRRSELRHQVQKPHDGGKKEFILPMPAGDNSHLYDYLKHERGISREVIDFFLNAGLIYEAAGFHNIVFKGNDRNGITRSAGMRGIYDRDGKAFKCDVAGGDKNYGFNIFREGSSEVVVFEAAIDAMSYMDISRDYESSLVALGMLWDAPLATFLSEHPQIQCITFCLDNDSPGRKASDSLMEKYYGLGFDVGEKPPPKQYKDYNEWLQAVREPTPVNCEIKADGKTMPMDREVKTGKTQSAGRCR
ncbi:MAG: DUF3991 and toprim domain-containing protein [Lachnospiraceae bacterium]|nr:DUF3991 and toprim domain-containing protein [Lachnospiraceae bacterium]